MGKVVLSLGLVLLFLISVVSAFAVQKNPISDAIIAEYYNQPAVYSLTASDITPDYYQIYTLTDVALAPKGYFYIYPNQVFNVSVYSTANLKERLYYAFTYYLKSQNGASYEDKIIVKIVNLTDALTIESDYLDPNNEKATFYINNRENVNLLNVPVKFSSPVFELTQNINVSPMGKTEINVDVDMEKMKALEAGSYVVNADFITDVGIKRISGEILLTEKRSVETQENSSGFLVRQDSVKKTNTGNVPVITAVTMKKDIISRLFTSFNIEPKIVERKGFGVIYTWNKKIQPTESLEIIVKTNYVLPFVTLLFAIILIVGFRKFTKSKVEFQKSVSYVKIKGGEFALKVKISIRARKSMHNVSLIDRIPPIVSMHEKFASPQPTKVDTLNKRVTWDIGELSAGEEREFSYLVYSRVGVMGKFSLPEALVVYESDGKMHEFESNQVFFLTEQIARDDD